MTDIGTRTSAVVPFRVLLVEDDPGDVLITREALAGSPLACEVTVIADGEAALAFLRKQDPHADALTPHLVLLDLNLPRVSGHEVLEQVKSDATLSAIPVVVLTTSESEEDIRRTYGLHANAYVTKPVDFERFQDAVRGIDEFFLRVAQLPQRATR